MSTWESAAEAWAREPGPNANPPATWGEIVAANARYGGLETMSGAGGLQEQAYRELEQQLRTVTGQDPATFTEQWSSPQTSSRGEPFLNVDKAYVIGQHLDKLDKGQREAIAPYLDVTGRAAAAAQKATAEDQAVFARTYGIGGNAVAWATYLGRQAIDPINIGAGLLTAAAGGAGAPGFLATLGREAVVGGVQAAATEPLVAAERERLGLPNASYLEAVAGGALFNVGFAGALHVGARGIVGTLRGAAAAGRWYRARGIEPPIHPADALAVADAVETQNVLAEQAQPATPTARAAMPERIDRAGQALEGHGVKPEDPVAGGGADPTPARVGDLEHQAATGAPPAEAPELGPHQVEIGGKRYAVTYKLKELGDLVVSHTMEGKPNPNYPQQAQPRQWTVARQSVVNEGAAHFRVNEALDHSESAAIGPPIVTPKNVAVVGNARSQMQARIYDRHPETAAAIRAGQMERGYDPTGMKYPILVRELREDLTPAELQFIGREGNVSPTGKMAAGEQAFSDASLLGDELLGLHRGGSVTSLANVPFVQRFVDRLVATSEREALISKDNVLSVEGVRRIEAALVAKAYEAPDIVAGLFEVTEPSSRAILGAFADNAAGAARVKAQIAAGRIAPELDPSPALVDAFRLVERARKSGQKVDLLAGQVDLELGSVAPATLDALDYYFRDPPKSKAAKEAGVAYRIAAGRVAIAPQIERAMNTALSKADAAGDLFGLKPDAGFALREGGTAEMPPGDLTAGEDLAAPAAEGAAAPAADAVAAIDKQIVELEADVAFADTHDARQAARGALDAAKVEREKAIAEEAAADAKASAEPGLALARADLYSQPPAPGTTPEAAAILETARTGTLPDRIQARASRDELAVHPDLVAADEYAASRTSTDQLPGYGTPEFWATRVYKLDGETFVGRPAYVARMIAKARSYAQGVVRRERKATIVLGSPAAGKSTISEPHAARMGAAMPDADDIKQGIDAFEGGLGAPATHRESMVLQADVMEQLTKDGDNLVLQKCGDWAPGVRDLIQSLKDEGYQVDLINMSVDPDEAFRRMASRYLGKGRLIPIKAMLEIGNKSSDVYYILKEENLTNGTLHETVEVDANGAFGAERPILDGADTELAAGLRREESGLRGERGALAADGKESGSGDGVAGLANKDVQAGQVAPAKPLGDPQLAAEADSVIADVGENFQIKLAEPGSDEVRTLSIAEARAEAAEVDAAAEELLACIAGAAGVTAAAGGAAAAGVAAAP